MKCRVEVHRIGYIYVEADSLLDAETFAQYDARDKDVEWDDFFVPVHCEEDNSAPDDKYLEGY